MGSMSNQIRSDITKPYHVVTTGGTVQMCHDNEAEADKDADDRNDRALAMGIDTRYIVKCMDVDDA